LTPVLAGVAGPSGSGKTELSRRLRDRLEQAHGIGSRTISLDSYYADLREWPLERRHHFNFDHPDSLDQELLVNQVAALARGEAINCPVYEFATHTRSAVVEHIEPAPVVIVEGLFALYFADLRDLYRLKVYVETPDETCLDRRLARDVRERGRTVESIRDQYATTVRPMAEQFVRPTKAFADLAVSGTRPIQESVEACLQRLMPLLSQAPA
jgi:uridine kinase